MARNSVVVIDLDGTLCNSGHRDHLAVAGQWDEFHSKLAEDEPWPDVLELIRLLSDNPFSGSIIGLTGRNERYRMATVKWLAKHKIWIDDLLMRPDNDWRSDHELKPAMLEAYLAERSNAAVWFILEDRDKVVEAWRNLGYSCWQVRPGGY